MYIIYITTEQTIEEFKNGKKYTKNQALWVMDWIKDDLTEYKGSKIKSISAEWEYESYGHLEAAEVIVKIDIA